MPSEPDQTPIEGLLKSYAKQRAEDASGAAELHPATRRLLQGEVATLRRAAEATGGRSWVQTIIFFWPRLAAVSAILVMLATGVWLLLPDSQPSPTTLARIGDGPYRAPLPGDQGSRDFYERPLAPAQDAPMPERAASEPAFAPAVVPLKRELNQSTSDRPQDEKRFAEQETRARQSAPRPDGERRSEEMLHADAERPPRMTAAQEPAGASKQKRYLLADAQVGAGASLSPPVPASPASRSLAQAQSTDALGVSRSVPHAPSATPVPQSVPAPAVSLVVADSTNASGGKLLSFRRQEMTASSGVTGGLAALNLRFVQSDKEQKSAALKASPDAGALLGNFQLLREGRVVRVIDGDGSIYVGQMFDSGATTDAGRDQGGIPPAQAGGTDVHNPQFRVAGTHRTTGREVIFEGSLLSGAGARDAVDSQSKNIDPAPKGLAQRGRSPGGNTLAATASVSSPDGVVGTVRVNGTNSFPIRAFAVPR